VIYVTDIDSKINCKLLKFAHDTKLFGVVAKLEEFDQLRADLQNLCDLSKEWLMMFNVEKWKVMHFGRKNENDYEMKGHIMEIIVEEKEL